MLHKPKQLRRGALRLLLVRGAGIVGVVGVAAARACGGASRVEDEGHVVIAAREHRAEVHRAIDVKRHGVEHASGPQRRAHRLAHGQEGIVAGVHSASSEHNRLDDSVVNRALHRGAELQNRLIARAAARSANARRAHLTHHSALAALFAGGGLCCCGGDVPLLGVCCRLGGVPLFAALVGGDDSLCAERPQRVAGVGGERCVGDHLDRRRRSLLAPTKGHISARGRDERANRSLSKAKGLRLLRRRARGGYLRGGQLLRRPSPRVVGAIQRRRSGRCSSRSRGDGGGRAWVPLRLDSLNVLGRHFLAAHSPLLRGRMVLVGVVFLGDRLVAAVADRLQPQRHGGRGELLRGGWVGGGGGAHHSSHVFDGDASSGGGSCWLLLLRDIGRNNRHIR